MKNPGRVVFVGAGPGAPDLLTVRAAACLRQADTVVHDALVPRQLLDTLRPGVECIPVPRDDASERDSGASAGRLLVRLASEGRSVVRLKGGDPSVFARLAEELEPLHDAGIAVEIVPGVTAALAAAAAAGVPLTSRASASSLSIVTGRDADEKSAHDDFRPLAAFPGTLAVYMGVEQAARWSEALIAAGKPGDTPVVIVTRCSWPDQRITTTTLERCADDLVRHGWQPPAVIVVGEALQPRREFGPLAARCVLVTRPEGQADDLAALVRSGGGECLHVPLVRIEPPESWQPLDEAVARSDSYDWLVFASVNAVRGFVARMQAARLDGRCLGTARLAAIGPATRQALESAGLVADLAPATYSSEGVVAAFAEVPPGGRFLLVRADKGRDVMRRELTARGHVVDEVAAYRSRPVEAVDPDVLDSIDRSGVDWLTVTSPSIAETAVRVFADRLKRWRIASLSPVTSAALERAGFSPTVEAAEATAAGLVAAIAAWESAPAGVAPSAESPQPAR